MPHCRKHSGRPFWPSRDEVFTLADVTLPSLGESVTEGIITRWMKNVGDMVARDEPLFEISTDKVDSELPSPADGVLLKILAHEGDTVNVGAVVAVIGELDGSSSPAPAAPSPSASTPSHSAPIAEAPSTSAPKSTNVEGPSTVVSPLVRRILADG
ncbi:MAG: hypothetical protein KJS64_06455, partial [Acidobacteria bacterium]|nr:hypothetical protein [Acidobacteriota bacterium]